METTDLSIASPLQQTIPVFATIIEPLVLSNLGYDVQTILAALVTTLGAYVVVIEPEKPLEPLRRITDRGPLLAVVTALLLALNSIISHSVTQSLEVSYFLLIASVSGFVVLTFLRREAPDLRFENMSYGLVFSGNLGFSILTLSLVVASIATVFFRLSLVLNILVGFFVFEEENIRIRLVGSLVVMAGIGLTVV
jgi:drug/metabolite transporter (DMT)-like permease